MISWNQSAGYTFEGPVRLEDWEPRGLAGVCVLCRPRRPDEDPPGGPDFVPLYVGDVTELLRANGPWSAPCVERCLEQVESRDDLFLAFHYMPFTTRDERAPMVKAFARELEAVCNRA